MRRSIIAALFAASIAAGAGTAANAVPAGASLIAAKVAETNVTQVYWRGWRRPRAFGYYRRPLWRGWHRPRVYGYYGRRVYGYRPYRFWHRPRVFAYSYAPRSYGWLGFRRCW
jgi:hypothetical protein